MELTEEMVELYFKRLPPIIADLRYAEILDNVTKLFSIGPIHPVHMKDSIKLLSPNMKSPGMPYISRGLKTIQEVDTSFIRLYLRNIKYGVYDRIKFPCVVTTPSNPEAGKISLIFPAACVFAEGMFTIPLVKEIKAKCGTWIGFDKAENILHMPVDKDHQQWLSLVWKDSEYNHPAWLIWNAFDILHDNFDFSRYQEFGGPATDTLLPVLWMKIIQYFVNTPMKLYTGKIRLKRQGVPFDSLFAKLVQTICNVIVCKYLLMDLGVDVVLNGEWYAEDKAVIAINSNLDLTLFGERAFTYFGFELDSTKSIISNKIV